MVSLLYPAFVLGSLGTALSLVLLVAARRFAVYEDPLVRAVDDALPKANCGACGYAGCKAFAENIVKSRDSDMFCPPGGKDTAGKIANMLGMEVTGQEPPVAVVMCEGTEGRATRAGKYQGLHDCVAAHLIDGGEKLCSYGCLGLGSCITVCDYDAIVVEGGIAKIVPDRCVGCGACVRVCPRGLIRMTPRDVRVFVACASHDLGKATRKYCEVGCVGCKLCAKVCEDHAIQISQNLARVDHGKCTQCGLCIGACPREVVFGVNLSPEARENAIPRKKKKAAAKKETSNAPVESP